ncbi:YaiI/YqxD family protein [Clostridium sp. 'White wine YQ']|uniref:YaiI/YqxD family protein n=1 Tax=Clostridium sp. 'White wine YQ' TaxID=3027474 RepID=UPI002367056F|nr:YaiI/YqxD family protein [Clostridium sp. 'White wine YQ']MDD7795753.1 YaiI/YqxD family protein [Clostridium sp. 'White wine YQ']
MRILVDADGCPGRSIIEKLAGEYNIPLFLYCDINHNITLSYGEVVVLDKGYQSVDMCIANKCIKGDLVITQDYGLASLILGKGGIPINPNGMIYTNENIDRLLFERHLSAKARRAGGKTSNHRKRTSNDDEMLYKSIEKIIKNSMENSTY